MSSNNTTPKTRSTLLLGRPSERRALLTAVLESRLHDVRVCDTVDEAYRSLEDRSIHLAILTEINSDSLDFSRRFHEEAFGPRMVIAVADMEVVRAHDLCSTGVDDIIEPRILDEAALGARLCFIERRLGREYERSRRAGRRVEQALRESEARTQAIVETTVDGIVTIDERGIIESFNAAAERIFGYDADEVIGHDVSILMSEPYRSEHPQYMENYLRTGRRKIIGIGREMEGRRKDGSTFPLELAVSEFWLAGGRRAFTGIVRDISERRRMEQEILRIGDQERRRIGQDLHDGLGQMLTGIGLISQSLARRLKVTGREEWHDVDEITTLIKESDQFARGLARSLVPVDVEARGLVSALRRMAGNAERLFRITCRFEEHGDALIHDENSALHLYRIAQEAVSNAVKHGHATTVTIGLSSEENQIRLWVEDDGTGFPDDWREHQGLGVRTMAYRARIIGATLNIGSPAGSERGTVITCVLRNSNHVHAAP